MSHYAVTGPRLNHVDPLKAGTTTNTYAGNTVIVDKCHMLDYSVAGKPSVSIRNTHASNVIKYIITGYYDDAELMPFVIQAETTLAGVTSVSHTVDSRVKKVKVELASNLADNHATFTSVFNGMSLTGRDVSVA
jgi:hypothetical protein